MKNFKHYLFGALTMSAALAFTACTSENEVVGPQENVKGFYMRLSLEGETPTRTELEGPTKDATPEESEVTTGTLFLFQGRTLKFQKKITTSDWVGAKPSQGVTGTTNVIAVSVKNVEVNTEYSVYFLANDANDNQAELDVVGNPLDFIYDAKEKREGKSMFAGTMANNNAFVMFNQNGPSASAKADQYKVEFTNANKSMDTPATIKGGKAIKIERLVARIDKPVVEAQTITAPETDATPDQQDAQAKVQSIALEGYALSNLPKKTYVMQHWGASGEFLLPPSIAYFNAYAEFGDKTELGVVPFGNDGVNYVFENIGAQDEDEPEYTAMYMKYKVTLNPDANATADFTDGTFYRYDHKIYTSLQSIINSIGGTNPFGKDEEGNDKTVEVLLGELKKNAEGGCDATEAELSTFRTNYNIEVFHKGFCYYNVPVEAQNQKFTGYYTTLRNTIYKITVKNIFNVGTDVPNGDPDEKKPNYYMQVSVDVNPWVLKAYDIDLQ